ncbi:glycosyl transferase-like protein [Leptotrombidium deliense]|uniref:Glycosyl transferase-like protein n=1 Tax=Leptotrombidium deliense TaxID=299467 RepID=A0A443SKZ2_9ACAR|nr:glycosyl transferase-like protein [Leptotrombidium deliense]
MESLKILFVSMSDIGGSHPIIGLAIALRNKGHEVFIATERSWEGKFEKYGLKEKVYDERDINCDTLKDNSVLICSLLEAIKKGPIEICLAVDSLMPTFAQTAKISSFQIKQIIECVKPDVIVENSLIMIPAVLASNIPLVRMFTTQPLFGMDDERLPPSSFGLPTNDDKDWSRFLTEAMLELKIILLILRA